MIAAIVLTTTGAWFAAAGAVCWFLHRATRALPEHPDRAPRHEALYVPAEWLVEL